MDRSSLIASAQKYIQKGQFDKAVTAYRKLVAADPSDVRLLLKIADLQVRAGLKDEAVQTYNEAADHFISRNFIFKALAVYKQLVRLVPEDIDVRMRLADLHVEVSLINDARRLYAELVKVLERDKDTDRAIIVMERLASIEPEDVSLRIRLGELYARQGRTERAAEVMVEAGRELLRTRRYNEYGRVAERILAWREDDAETLRGLAKTLVVLGEPRKAIARAQQAFRQNPEDVDAVGILAEALVALEEEGRARKLLGDLEGRFRKDGRTDLADQMAEKLEALGSPRVATTETPIAVAALAAAAQARPVSAEVQRMLDEVGVYRKYGMADKALGHIDKIMGLDGTNEPALVLKLEILQEKGDTEAAAAVRRLLDAIRSGEAALIEGDIEDDMIVFEEAEAEEASFFGGGESALDDAEFVVVDDEVDFQDGDEYAIPAELRAAVLAASQLARDGDENAGRAGMLELLGDWPAHAELVLQAMDSLHDLPSIFTRGTLEDMPDVDLEGEIAELDELDDVVDIDGDAVEFVDDDVVDIDGDAVEFVDDDDDEDIAFVSDDDTGEFEFVDDDDDDVEVVPDEGDGFDMAVLDFADDDDAGSEPDADDDFDMDALDFADDDVVNIDGDAVEFVDDDVVDIDGDAVEFVDDDVVDIDGDAVEFADDGVVDIDGDAVEFVDGEMVEFADDDAVEVDAPIGRSSSAVGLVFGPSHSVLEGKSDSGLADAIRQRMDGNGMMVMSVFEEEIFGADMTSASYELAMAQMQMGLYVEASMGFEGLLQHPDLAGEDVALIHYTIGLCHEALGQTDKARAAFEAATEEQRHFPDLSTRLSRLS